MHDADVNCKPLINLGKYIIHQDCKTEVFGAFKEGKCVMERLDLFQLLVDLHVRERLRKLYLPSSIPLFVYVFMFFYPTSKRNKFVFMNSIELLRYNKNSVINRLRILN